MTHPIDWPGIFASNPDANDVEIRDATGASLEVVGQHRRRLGIPRRIKPRAPNTKPVQLWTRCTEATHSAVAELARAEGTNASAWVLAAIVERMERVQRRMAYLTVKEAVDAAKVATDYIGHP